jgi:FMN phosphatase YigB (HAD superfamily)
VVFDVGETIVDETRAWSEWADWLGIPRLTFLAAVGAAIARGAADHRAPFYLFRPGIDLAAERRLRDAAGRGSDFWREDLYPDVEPTLQALSAAGYRLAISGNQPSRAEAILAGLSVPLEFAASSESWGVAKPDPAFFARIVDELGLPPNEVAYVGDRLDNDIRPAAAAGLQAIFVRRGPWAWIQAGRSNPPEAALVVETLAALPAALAGLAPP